LSAGPAHAVPNAAFSGHDEPVSMSGNAELNWSSQPGRRWKDPWPTWRSKPAVSWPIRSRPGCGTRSTGLPRW